MWILPHPRRFALLATLVAGALLVVLIAGGPSVDAKVTRKVKASDTNGLKFNKKTIHAPAGKVTFVINNPGSNQFPHAIEIEGKGVEKESKTIGPGKQARVTVTLKKGRTYEFYCPVPGHRAAGMEGKVVVG